MYNRGSLSVLVHPLGRTEVRDHTTDAMWLGPSFRLDLSTLNPDGGDDPQYPELGLGYSSQHWEIKKHFWISDLTGHYNPILCGVSRSPLIDVKCFNQPPSAGVCWYRNHWEDNDQLEPGYQQQQLYQLAGSHSQSMRESVQNIFLEYFLFNTLSPLTTTILDPSPTHPWLEEVYFECEQWAEHIFGENCL